MHLFKSSSGRDDALSLLRNPDRYRILGQLGAGRTADVVSALDTRTNRMVALKCLRERYRHDSRAIKRFINEIRLISYLDHPGVVALHDAFLMEDGLPAYAMKLFKGAALRWDMQSKTRGQLLAVFIKLCETMASVHDRGVAHCDINPESVVSGQYGEVLIMDWANAHLFDERPYRETFALVRDAPEPPVDEDDRGFCGAEPYMSPELIQGTPEAMSAGTDIFSMGVMLYEMMSGAAPFAGDAAAAIKERICTVEPPALHQTCPDIPLALSRICGRMMHKDPFMRYHSFHEVLIDIDRFQNSGQAFQARKLDRGQIICREGERGDFAFVVVAGSVVVYRESAGERAILATLGQGEIVGELSIFAGEPRTATVAAAESGTIIRIMDRQSVEQELGKLSPWVDTMITGLSKRFIALNDMLSRSAKSAGNGPARNGQRS
jgi:serine/threonine-protein kinase